METADSMRNTAKPGEKPELYGGSCKAGQQNLKSPE